MAMPDRVEGNQTTEADESSTRAMTMSPEDVGGELLDILSTGLYSDARDIIREYAQNGIDAAADQIIVTVRGANVSVRDDGSGMDRKTLLGAKRLGMSEKSAKSHVGFRGIGIYSAFGMCESLSVFTHQAGNPEALRLTFDFGKMRRVLEEDRKSDVRRGIGLVSLLEDHVHFDHEEYKGNSTEDHFTVVELNSVSQEYRAKLHDAGALSAYLLNTLPISFPQEGYGRSVNFWLAEHVRLHSTELVLRVENEPERRVQPQLVSDTKDISHSWVEDGDGKQVAFLWHALSSRGRRIPKVSGVSADDGLDGFLLKLKGFTLGNRSLLKSLWPLTGGRALYHHFTGEVHLLEAAQVFPNAARNDLEPSPFKQSLEKHLAETFRDLDYRADFDRELHRAQSRIGKLRIRLSS